ncbi:ChbG/HpnK family deacetylase [Patescibacteria group bacterium]|nr:ChbG/HpnK family deacetylase [Patescibacteria group bacterium]
MKKLIIVADDFGWTRPINEGLVRSYEEGIVSEISLMLNSPATDHALQFIKKHRLNNVGLHMLLINKQNFNRDDYVKLFQNKSSASIEKLAISELELFEKLVGKKPTHIIPQYGIHGNLKLLQILINYVKEENIPMRIPRTALSNANPDENYAAEIMFKRSGIKTTNYLFGHVTGCDLVEVRDKFLDELRIVKEGESAEILLHPGYFGAEILKYSSVGYERARDLALSLDDSFKKSIMKMGFEILSYSQL